MPRNTPERRTPGRRRDPSRHRQDDVKARRGKEPRRAPPPIDPAPVAAMVQDVVRRAGGEVLDLRITPHRDVLLTVDRDDGPIETDLLVRVLQDLRRRIADVGEDPGDFRIEVDSPGAKRPLRTTRHFERFAGAPIVLVGEDGAREPVTLVGLDGDGIRVRDADGAERAVDPGRYAEIRLDE